MCIFHCSVRSSFIFQSVLLLESYRSVCLQFTWIYLTEPFICSFLFNSLGLVLLFVNLIIKLKLNFKRTELSVEHVRSQNLINLFFPAVVAVLRSCCGETASGGRWDTTSPQRHGGPQQRLLTGPPASSTVSSPSPGGRAAPTSPTLLWSTAPSTPPSSRTRLQTADLQRVAPLRNEEKCSFFLIFMYF